MLDVECSIRGSAESYITKVKSHHRGNSRLFEPKPFDSRYFGIQHFAGRVIYDATDFLGLHNPLFIQFLHYLLTYLNFIHFVIFRY